MLTKKFFPLVGCALLGVLVAVLSGCGSSSSDPGGGSLSKAELAKQAEAICKKRQDERLRLVKTELGTVRGGRKGQERFVMTAVIAPIKKIATELGSLDVSKADQANVDRLISSINREVQSVEAEPINVLHSGAGRFEETDEVANVFGYKACAEI